MSVWLSSGAFKADTVSEILQTARREKIVGIELSSGQPFEPNVETLLLEAHGSRQQRFLVHNYFPAPEHPFVLNISALDEHTLEQTISFARNAILLARNLGAPFYSIHAGFAASVSAEHLGKPRDLAAALREGSINRPAAYQRMKETVTHLAGFCADLDMDLLIENNVIAPALMETCNEVPFLLTAADEIEYFFEDLNLQNVGLLLDVAHARVSATALSFSAVDFVDRVRPFVKCLHLSDNDTFFDNNQPIQRGSWFLPQIREFKDCEIVIEAYNLTPDQMREQISLVNDALGR